MTEIIKLKKEEVKVYTFYATIGLMNNQGSITYKVALPAQYSGNGALSYNLIAENQRTDGFKMEVEGFELAKAHAIVIKSIFNNHSIEMHEHVKEVQKYKVD